ncbi:MAG: hypothetical protein PHU85_14740 [Phycisphaerae bacterium]|nr:hypothetical protein [Phycisphaerae bacterium]
MPTAAEPCRRAFAFTLLLAASSILPGCGIVEKWFGGQHGYLLLGVDALAYPGEHTELVARLQKGSFLDDRPNREIVFSRGEHVLARAITDDEGYARARWMAPTSQGEYLVTVSTGDRKLAERAGTACLLISVHDRASRVLISDLDHTLVDGGFKKVLTGKAAPLPGSADVLNRAEREKGYVIVYLTRRPDVLGKRSRNWLDSHGFPRGPIITSDSLLIRSEKFKRQHLEELKRRFPNLEAGIGDLPSDVHAYRSVDVRLCILIVNPGDDFLDRRRQADELSRLDERVILTSDWQDVAGVLFDGRSPERKAVLARLLASHRGK